MSTTRGFFTRRFAFCPYEPCRLAQAVRRSLLIGMLLLLWLLPAGSATAAAGADEGGDRIVLVGSVLVDRDETAGNVVVVDGDVTIRGTVKGDVIAIAGDVTIRGTVEGDVATVSGLATLGRRGSVGGDIVYADEKPVRTPGSRVGGDVRKFDAGSAGLIGAIGTFIAFTISGLLLGLILILLAPRAADAVGNTARTKAGMSAAVGLLAFILIPVIAVAALFTIVGIPLGVVLLFLIVPLAVISYVTAGFAIGRLMLKSAPRLLAFLAGIVLLALLTLIPIAGALIGFLAVIFGLGLLVVTMLRARSSPVVSQA